MKPKESTTRKTRTMDVRPLIAAGEHPLQKIMEMIATLGPTDELVLLTPFLPAPLIEKLGVPSMPGLSQSFCERSANCRAAASSARQRSSSGRL